MEGRIRSEGPTRDFFQVIFSDATEWTIIGDDGSGIRYKTQAQPCRSTDEMVLVSC